MAKTSGHKQAKAQLKGAIERIVDKADSLWAAIEEGKATSKEHLERGTKIRQLDPNSPETKPLYDKLSKDWGQLHDRWYEQFQEFRGLEGEAAKALQQCGRWPIVEGQLDEFHNLQERWRDLPQSSKYLEDVEPVQRCVGTLKRLLSDTLGKLASEAQEDADEPVERVVGSGQPATTGGRGRGLETSRKRIDFCEKLQGEIAKVVLELESYTTLPRLKEKFPDLQIWKELSEKEQEDLLNTEREKLYPAALAKKFTLRRFGLTSESTLKNDRRKLREAKNL